MTRRSALALGSSAFVLVLALAAPSAASADATYQTIYAFTGGSDGNHPRSGLVMDAAGNLYGTAPQGGALNLGTLFKLAPDGTFTLLHTFKGGRDGAIPTAAALTLDAHGTIYGMTEQGGTANGGVAYRFKNGKMTVLHSFGLGNDGYGPMAGLLFQPDGSLIGTTDIGGGSGCASTHGCGTIFSLASDGSETILHAFGGADGANPTGTPVRDLAGNLYGTTMNGGASNKGSVYKLASDNTASVVYSFTSQASMPYQGLTVDKNGNLYGTTEFSHNDSSGTAFKVDAQGNETPLLGFSNGPGYGTGLTGMIADKHGNLYGTLSVGGGNQTGDCHFAGGCGVFFIIDVKKHQITNLHGFGGSDGQHPEGSVVSDGHGNYYGTTMWGGSIDGNGTIFKITMGTK